MCTDRTRTPWRLSTVCVSLLAAFLACERGASMSDQELAHLLAQALLATGKYATVPGQLKTEHERLVGQVGRSLPEVWDSVDQVGADPERWAHILTRVREELREAGGRQSSPPGSPATGVGSQE